MKYVERLLLVFIMIFQFSCSKGNNSTKDINTSSPTSVVKGGSVSSQIEIQQMNELLNKDPSYELKISDIDELKDSGLITAADHEALLVLVSNK